MTEFNPFADLVLPSSFAKEKGATPQTVMNWIEKGELKPKFSEGRTKLFSRTELEDAMLEHGKGSKAGYVHPDKYKAVEDHRDRLILITIERDAEITALKARLTLLDALEAAGVDNWEGYDHAMSILNGEDEV